MRGLRRKPVRIVADPGVDLTPAPEPWQGLLAQPGPVTDAHRSDGDTPCRVCGFRVPAHGTASTYFGVWRQHRTCARAETVVATRVRLAIRWTQSGEVTEQEAGLLRVHVPLFSEVVAEPTAPASRTPWAHVDRKLLVQALADLPDLRVEAGLDPGTCTAGRCWLCGRAEAHRWHSEGHRWPDGGVAPLCGDCARVFVKFGSPRKSMIHTEARLMWLSEALTGQPAMMGDAAGVPEAFTPYGEGPAGAGDGRPWSHLPSGAVEGYRWLVWTRYGGRYAPREVRAEAQQRAAEREAQRAAATAAQAAEGGRR